MRKAIKIENSEIIIQELRYISRNSNNNRKISEILSIEQKGFCAYTDEYISRTDAADIEHFNPTLKDTNEDDYGNWFLVKHQWNNEKLAKWEKYQPILHPSAEDFEERIIYLEGDYIVKSEEDIEASNLIKLLQLDDAVLAENRKKYINRKKEEIKTYQENPQTYFIDLIDAYLPGISYLRAIKEEFGVDLWEHL